MPGSPPPTPPLVGPALPLAAIPSTETSFNVDSSSYYAEVEIQDKVSSL